MNSPDTYESFLKAKITLAVQGGFEISEDEINPLLMPHQKAAVIWAIAGGCRGIFAKFGLGESIIQMETVRIILTRVVGMGLIVIPLGVRQEFMRDAEMLNTGNSTSITDAQREELRAWQAGRPDRLINLKFVRRIEECDDPHGIYLTNYETVRNGKLNPQLFIVASLDEAACLRGFGGSKTFREFMRLFAGDGKTLNERIRSKGVRYRFVATATPSPNEYIELLAYAAFLDILDVSGAKTRFFKRDSTKADQLTLHKHKEEEFWLWVSSWALFISKPSDLGFDDAGYDMPEMVVNWHEVPSDYSSAGAKKWGQGRLIPNVNIGVSESAREKRTSLNARVAKMMEIRAEDPAAHRILWHDLEDERHAIQAAAPESVAVYGSLDLDSREAAIIGFGDGKFQEISGKPSIMGSGPNLQRHCHWAIFLGIGFKFNDLIQAIHRVQRFGQAHTVRIDLIYTEAERGIRRTLERKWEQHNTMTEKMTNIIKEFGLSKAAMTQKLTRSFGVERIETNGENYSLINNDNVAETRNMAENSVDLIVTSIPFSTQYEYSSNLADFGHSDNNAKFFEQMDFLTPELLRVLQPGRLAAIHVKDRIVPGGMTGLGFQTTYPFHCKTIEHYTKHGFAYMGMKTIVTDVVRENNQTYRLGWTEQCKDGSKMSVGMPEYFLIFRKPPTDTSDSYADNPVVKRKNKYSRSRWQIDAHGFTRSSGNRLLRPEELLNLDHSQIFKVFRDFSLAEIYDFEHHIKLGEALDEVGMLPVTFMLLQPQSWSNEVWTDITRMLTLNGTQWSMGKEQHLCPMQFDLADRAIAQWSMPGETVFDPFGGLMTVPYRALKLGRKGVGIELNPQYFADGAAHCMAMEKAMAMPDLFAFEEIEHSGNNLPLPAEVIAEIESAAADADRIAA